MVELVDIYNIVADYLAEQPIHNDMELDTIMDDVADQVRMCFCDFANDNDMDFVPIF